MPSVSRASRAGFTLMEILVALVLIGLLVGTLLPSVVSQVSRGEVNRVAEDLDGVLDAAKTFRVDVSRWPGDLEDLYSAPTTGDAPVTGGSYPAGLAAKWSGPYFEAGALKGDTLPTALGGVVVNSVTQTRWGGKDFITLRVKNVVASDAQALSLQIDGDTVVTAYSSGTTPNENAGRVRWVTGGGVDTLIYLGAPVK